MFPLISHKNYHPLMLNYKVQYYNYFKLLCYNNYYTTLKYFIHQVAPLCNIVHAAAQRTLRDVFL